MARFRVDGMKCEGCARKVTGVVQDLFPGVEVKVDLAGKTVEVSSAVEALKIEEAVSAAGFPAQMIG